MKAYLYIDKETTDLYLCLASSENEAQQLTRERVGVEVDQMVRVEAHVRSPKVIQLSKLIKVSEVKNEATIKAKKVEVEPTE